MALSHYFVPHSVVCLPATDLHISSTVIKWANRIFLMARQSVRHFLQFHFCAAIVNLASLGAGPLAAASTNLLV